MGCRREGMGWKELLLSALVLVIMYRCIDWSCDYYMIGRKWLYFIDMGLAPTIFRYIITMFGEPPIYGNLYWKIGPFDFYDICIGIGCAGLIIFFVLFTFKYYAYFEVKAKEMRFKEKVRLETSLLADIFRPRSRWKHDESMEGIKVRMTAKGAGMTLVGALLCIYIFRPYYNRYFPKQSKVEEAYVEPMAEEKESVYEEPFGEGAADSDMLWRAEAENRIQRYPLHSMPPYYGKEEDYICLLSGKSNNHEVKAGDTLWGLARRFYGRGIEWKKIKRLNPDLPGDGTLLYPGMELLVPEQIFYIKRQESSSGGFSSEAFSYDSPRGWESSIPDWEPCLDKWYSVYQEDVCVYTHTTQNELYPEGIGEDEWKDMQEGIRQALDKTKNVDCFNLEFSRYRMQTGEDLLCYTFICDNGIKYMQYAVAYVAGDRWLTEFIGKSPCPADNSEASYTDIIGITRYMAASFVDEGGEKTFSRLKYRPYLGHEYWPFEELHNPFALAEEEESLDVRESFRGEDKELTFESGKWENLLYRVVSQYNYMNAQQREELVSRPLRVSDLDWITGVELSESPIPERDRIRFQSNKRTIAVKGTLADYHLTTLQDIIVFPKLEKLILELGGISDYEVLKECTLLTELSVISQEFPTDLSWLRELPELKNLTLGSSHIGYLNNMGFQREEGSTFEAMDYPPPSFSSGELEEALAACPSLTYLKLQYSGTLDFAFLEELPNLYAFLLFEEFSAEKTDMDRKGRFADEAAGYCPQIKCLVIDEKWLRNQE